MFISIILIICCFGIVTSNTVENWYWRNYDGLIPSDALPTGINAEGQNTYLAQIILPSQHPKITPLAVVPGTVTIGKSGAVGTYFYNVVRSTVNVKILCTSSPERYLWLSPFVIPIGCRSIIGGIEVLRFTMEPKPTYIARTHIIKPHNEIIIGKLVMDEDGLIHTMGYAYNGTERYTSDFQALFYCYN